MVTSWCIFYWAVGLIVKAAWRENARIRGRHCCWKGLGHVFPGKISSLQNTLFLYCGVSFTLSFTKNIGIRNLMINILFMFTLLDNYLLEQRKIHSSAIFIDVLTFSKQTHIMCNSLIRI